MSVNLKLFRLTIYIPIACYFEGVGDVQLEVVNVCGIVVPSILISSMIQRHDDSSTYQ